MGRRAGRHLDPAGDRALERHGLEIRQAPQAGLLSGVAAVSASDVWAVGEFSKPGVGFQTLIEQWNGHKWGVVPSPDVGSLDELTAVTAVSASDVWAVGFSEANPSTFPFPQTLILHWDGTSWSIVPSPNPGPLDSRLSGVTAVTSTVIEQWDGTSWSVVPSPDPSTAENILAAAAADPASGQAWAVGEFFDNATSTRQTLTEFNP